MANFSYSGSSGLERKRVIVVQPAVKSIAASLSMVKCVPNTSVRRLATAMNGFKAIAGSLVISVAMAGAPALATKGPRYDANWYSCEQNAVPCRPSIFGACVSNRNCAARTPVPKPMQEDNWPANMILGLRRHSIGA
jgi:hypothetical protein